MIPQFVYFDLGNVLCFFDHHKSVENMAAITGADTKTIREIVYVADLEHRYETGLVTGQEFVNEIASKLGLSGLECEKMLYAASDMFQPNHDILPILDRICEMKIPMGILSNTCDAHWDWIIRQSYPQLKYPFEPIVLSYEEKVMKPNPEIYRLSTEKAEFAPGDIFFTDDRTDNIEAAKAYGWNTHLFTDAASLLQVIDEWK